MQTKINYLAVVSCVVINMLLGIVWYGAFAEPWMAGNGLTEERIKSMPASNTPYLISILGALIVGYVIANLFKRMSISGWLDGAKTGAALGLIPMVGYFTNNAFSMRSTDLSWIDGGYAWVLVVLYSTVIGGWQRK